MPIINNLTTIKKKKISILPKGLTQFSGTYPNNFQEFDENKETNYISFDLPTLTVDSNNGFFTPKVENGCRKYPYYIGIADNNGSTLPAEFNPSLYNFYEMFGVHFFDKALDIVIKQAIIGCKKYPFFSNAQIYTKTDTDTDIVKKGYVCAYSYKNINKVSLPTLLSFTVLNGVEEPKVYIDDDRLNLYTDKYIFGTTNTNTNSYKNIRFERRLFIPTPYKKVYNITKTDIETSGIRFYYKPFRSNEFTRIDAIDYETTDQQYERIDNLTKEEFKLEKFYVKDSNGNYIRQTKYYDNSVYYVKKQLYIINSKYGEYQLEPVTCSDDTSNILCYRKGEMVLWKEPVKEHGIEVSSDYVTSDGEVIDTRSVEDATMPYNVTDNGKYQYVAVDNDETTIYATDEYDEYTLTHYNGVKILSNGVLYFGSSKDAYNFCAKSEEKYKEEPEATMYVFYYLDNPQETDYTDNDGKYYKFGNHSTYQYLTLADFIEVNGNPPVRRLPEPGQAGRALYHEMMAKYPQQKVEYISDRDTNYPYDWVEKDKYDKGWTFTGTNVDSSDKKIPVLFTKKHTVGDNTALENINLQEYPGYICKITAKKNELRMRLNDTINSLIIYGNEFDTQLGTDDLILEGFYEKNCDYAHSEKLSNLRFFTVTDFDNNRIVSPVIDARTLHVTYMNYTSDSPENVRVPGYTERLFDFNVVEDFDAKYVFDAALLAQAYTKNEIYIWPQRPTIGEQYADGSIYDILEMPYLTNYEFEFSSGFPKRRTTQNDTDGEVEMKPDNFPELGENEFWEFAKDTSMKIDLTKAVSGTNEEYQRLGYKIAYVKFRDYKTKKYTYNQLLSMKDEPDGDGLKCEFYPNDDKIAPGWPKYLYYASQGSSSEHKAIHWKSGSATYPIPSTSSIFALLYNTHILNNIKMTLANSPNFETDEPIIFTCYARAIKINPNNFPSPPSLEPWTNFLVRDVTNIQRYMTSSTYMAINEIDYAQFLTAVQGGYNPGDVNVWFDKNNSQGTLAHEVIGVSVGGTLVLPRYEGTKDGYVQVNGWSRSNTATTAEYPFESTITVNEGMILYAVFVPQQTIQYTVTFSKNGSTGTLNPDKYTINDGSTLTLPRYEGTKDGYVQIEGWATSSDASSPQYSFGQQITVTDNMTLYAVFVEQEPGPEPEDNE